MADTFSKKEREKKKAKKKQDKAEKREDRKTDNNKGKGLEEMMAYLDENGNIVDTPPDQQQKEKKPSFTDRRGTASGEAPDDTVYTGMVSLLFVDKDYGFITEDDTRSTVFVHSSKFKEPIKEKDRVSFFKKKTPNGYSAVNVKKIQ